MSSITFRNALPEDGDAVLPVVAAAFGYEEGTERWQRTKGAFLSGQPWRLAEADGEVVAALQVSLACLRVGEGHLVKADVGSVAVDPGRQGEGLGTLLMRDTVAWMRAQGYDFSRLGGLVRFYSRFGYVPFVRRYVEFDLRPGVGAGAATAHPSFLEEPEESHVFTPDPETDRQRCRDLDLRCNAWRTGTPADTSGAAPESRGLVYREDGQVLAWLQLAEFPIDRTAFESRLTISSGAWEPGREDALAALVAHVLRLAHARGHERVSARLPFDPALFAALTEAELPYKAVELHEAAAATMVQVLNLGSFFEHLLPELECRWRRADLPLSACIGIECAGQSVALSLAPGQVDLNDGPAETSVALSQPALLTVALGLHAPSYLLEREAREAQPRLALLLDALFPEQLTTSGTWG